MSRMRIDRYMALAFASLAMMIPWSVAAFAHASKVDVGDHWVFSMLPGIGLAVCGVFGNSLVVSALLATTLPLKVERFCWALVTLSSVSLLYVLPLYKQSDYTGRDIETLLSGTGTSLYFIGILLMGEAPTPALLAISNALRSKAAARVAAADDVKGLQQRIILALAENDAQTCGDLASTVQSTAPTVKRHLAELMGAGKVTSREDLNRRAKVWMLEANG